MDHSYIKEIIKKMLFSFGNTPEIPTEEAIDITEKIVVSQLQMLLQLLYETAEHFESNEITHREFLFLIRHNEIKINRLLSFLAEKDLEELIAKSISHKSSFNKNIIMQREKMIYHSIDNSIDNSNDNSNDNNIELTTIKIEEEEEILKRFGPHKRKCYKYLSEFIPEWFPKWYIREIPIDATKQRRMIRFDMMSLKLDIQWYLLFSIYRRASFRVLGEQGMQIWLGKFKYPFADELAIEMLFYFAKEIVFELVDITLLYASNMAQSRAISLGSKEHNPWNLHEIPTALTGHLINKAFEAYTLSKQPNKQILVL